MAFACLTTKVKYGDGTIAQLGDGVYTGCGGVPVGPNETSLTCAQDYEVGNTVYLEAEADTENGWEIKDWEMTDDDGNVIIAYFNGATIEASALSIEMPPFDVTLTVSFIHPQVTLIMIPMTVGGCIQLISPADPYNTACHYTQYSQSLPAFLTVVGASAAENYQISAWTVNGVSQGTTASSISISLNTAATFVTVRVWFEAAAPCSTNLLTITTVGRGRVNPPSGPYCEDDTIILTPIPAYGYFFKNWSYDISTTITESGITLRVPMDANRAVTAVFEALPDFEIPNSYLFYCPSTTNKSNVVSFDFINSESNPSAFDKFHFRVNFYSDSKKVKLLYSASSLADNKRWFYNDYSYKQLPSDGVVVEVDETMNIVYDPEILPKNIMETQKAKSVNGSVSEIPLMCGVKYYVEVESYNSFDGVFSFVQIMTLILDCDDVDAGYWSYNKDSNNWLCSGQGKSDLQVSSSSHSQSIFSATASNIFGLFQIVWQTRRDGDNRIYGAIWDSITDHLYSSGQGQYDELKLKAGYNPIVIKDQAENFFIAGRDTKDIYINACPIPVSVPDTPEETSTEIFAKLCGPGLNNYLSSAYDQIKVRVREEDIDGSLVINSNKVVPIIKKKNINLDIDGIAGAYAVRVRNIKDSDWGGWINIDNNLYYAGSRGTVTTADDDSITPDDITYNAYRIDNSRFIVPWDVDKDNGLKRICCQVLTPYGISNVFCLDLFFNFDVPKHVFEFYSNSAFTKVFPTYNGQYVLSLKDVDGNIKTSEEDSAVIYFKVIFSEPIYKNENDKIPYSNTDLTFNVIQQGTNDSWSSGNGNLTRINNKIFWGQFTIYRDDGVFNKDGNTFIEILFPDTNISSGCLVDYSDKYNPIVTNMQVVENKDLTPEEIYNKIQTNNAGRVFDINQFKQYYDQDDDNFKFGNPGYFRG